jgi:hypothetical protein
MASTSSGRAVRLLGALIVIAGLGAGAAYGTSLVGTRTLATNVIQVCENPGNGALRVVADNQTDCHAKETPISWNVVGPPGPKGDPGADGVSPTVTQLAAGDSNCSAGGAAITDAAGSTAYVCSGSPFDGTFTSPNGSFTLQVNDNGIKLGGPGNQMITIAGSGLTIRAKSFDARIDIDAKLEAGANLDVRGGSTASMRAGGNLDLRGAGVSLNGVGSCAGAARIGDSVAGSVITAGSSTVCVGP